MTSYSKHPLRFLKQIPNLLWVSLIIIVWLYFWFWPWQGFFRSIYWIPLGIGIILFTIPGMCIYGLLTKHPRITLTHITFGFVISHLLLALIGTLGRLIHLSFDLVKFFFVLVGLILLLRYALLNIQGGIKGYDWQANTDKVLPLLLLILVAIIASLIVIQRTVSDDDLTYLAYVTNWQHSTSLDFKDVIFGEAKLVVPRFWLMSAPFAQALLTKISQVPGILALGGYYEPFLVILAVLCWYELARKLTLSPQVASAASIFQLTFLLLLSEYLRPGAPFFSQLSADKATAVFIFAPVFFQTLLGTLKYPKKGNFILFILTGFSLTLMHPIILAYAVFVAGVILLLNWKKIQIKKKAFITLILLLILLPHVALRFVNVSTQIESPYTTQDVFSQRGIENIIQRWGDTQFYGFNPNILDMNVPYGEKLPISQLIIARGWLVFPFLSLAFGLKKVREDLVAQFLLATFLLGLLAWIPFTGWIIGYFLSAYMLERAVWIFPFGISVVYPIFVFRDHINNLINRKSIISSNILIFATTIASIGIFASYLHVNNLPDIEKFQVKSQRYQNLAIAGKELDRLISNQAIVIGSPNLNDFIPSVSWKSQLITFRISDPSNMFYYLPHEIDERISDTRRLFRKSVSADEKMGLLEKYNVQFLFITPFDLRLFEELIETFPSNIKQTDVGGVVILQIDP